MTDSEIARLVIEGLRSISQGVEAVAKKLEASIAVAKTNKQTTAARKTESTSTDRRAKAKTQRTAIKKIVAKKRVPSAAETVLTLVNRSRKGIDVDTLSKKTGFNKKKLANILYKLKKSGKIKSIRRGVYTKA